jgi:ribosomal 30S subunit maturation factor RimM
MVYLPEALLPKDESLAVQDHDLIGFQVQDPSLKDSLVVIDVLERRMQPLLCLGYTNKEPHIFIPYVDAFIDRVELVTKTIHLKAPSELYQLD